MHIKSVLLRDILSSSSISSCSTAADNLTTINNLNVSNLQLIQLSFSRKNHPCTEHQASAQSKIRIRNLADLWLRTSLIDRSLVYSRLSFYDKTAPMAVCCRRGEEPPLEEVLKILFIMEDIDRLRNEEGVVEREGKGNT